MTKTVSKKISDTAKLRLALLVFFLALTVPTIILIKQAFSQLKWEAFHQYQQLAEELSIRINNRLIEIINTEEARSFSEYNYLIVEGDNKSNFLQRSPLSVFPVESKIPGLIGYFQIGNDNQFSTPLLPKPNGVNNKQFGLLETQKDQRQSLQDSIYQILRDNRLAPKKNILSNNLSFVQNTPEKNEVLNGQSEAMQMDYAAKPTAGSMMVQSAPNDLGSDVLGLNEIIASDDSDMAAGAYSLPQERMNRQLEPAEEDLPAVAAFDQLNSPSMKSNTLQKKKSFNRLGRVEDLRLDNSYQQIAIGERQQLSNYSLANEAKPKRRQRNPRKERSILPQPEKPDVPQLNQASKGSMVQVNIFESEIDPLEINLLDSGHFVIYRKVWRNNQRFIQGLLLEQFPFLNGIIEAPHSQTTLANMSDLITAYQGDVLSVSQGIQHSSYQSSTQELSGSLLYQTRLSAPFSDFELIYSITQLPSGPGASVITWVAVIILLVLCIGTYLMYRLSIRQMSLANQQQDFVSAVSHELKTPITSIRMYGEMLKEGWADENKKNTYYHFIFDESERLTRLINNILQLARMTRNDLPVELKPVKVSALIDNLKSKISSQIERAGFQLNIQGDVEAANAQINIDIDLFIQIIINLVDNAIKFSVKAENKTIELNYTQLNSGPIEFSIRDYGPGIAKSQMKKIFTLFYRSENELTRETVGTGIGLALVRQLTQTMDGKVDIVNCDPGCEFKLVFPAILTDK